MRLCRPAVVIGLALANGAYLVARLPAVDDATSVTYLSSHGGWQFVVIAAGATFTFAPNVGDYILAYALQKRAGGVNGSTPEPTRQE